MVFTELKKCPTLQHGDHHRTAQVKLSLSAFSRGQTAHTLQRFPLRLLGGKGHWYTLVLEVQHRKLTNPSNTFHCYHIELHCLLKQSCSKLLKETVTIQKSGGLAVNLTQMNYV